MKNKLKIVSRNRRMSKPKDPFPLTLKEKEGMGKKGNRQIGGRLSIKSKETKGKRGVKKTPK